MKKEYIIPIFVPHLGCPNDCTFCNQKTISGQTKEVTPKDVKETIEYYLKSFKDKNKYTEVAFFGGSFTGIEPEKQIALLEAAYEFIKEKKVNSIRISTRPDYIDKPTLKRLKKYKVKTIELGVQSTNDYILRKAKRGHSFEDVKKASKLIKRYGFTLGHQMMVGMQESTALDEMRTARDLAKLKPKIMRIYPVLVLKGTELEKEFEKGEYIPLTVNQAVERSKELCYFFADKKIKVIRVGLQTTDTISDNEKNDKSQIVAGPYHECFRQLVEASMNFDSIVKKIKDYPVKVKEVLIETSPGNVNNVVGYKRENIEKLKEYYDVDCKVKQNKELKDGKINIKITKVYTDFLDDKEEVKSKKFKRIK